MRLTTRGMVMIAIILTFIAPFHMLAERATADSRSKEAIPQGTPTIWKDPGDIASRDLLYGPGGKAAIPKGDFKFIEEDKSGSSPKFVVEDEQGRRWKVKIGAEAKPEAAATHLLNAVGYFTDETYFLPAMHIQGLNKLKRGSDLIVVKNYVYNARLERVDTGDKKAGYWNWFNNPFQGKKELHGLKVMMALINNWDLKESNNRIVYQPGSGELQYMISDLGATFGKTGGVGERSRGKASDYAKSDFIVANNSEEVDFVMASQPPFYMVVARGYWKERKRMTRIVKDIPIEDVKWITQLLAQLSDKQIADTFRGAGFKPDEVTLYAGEVRSRINELIEITGVRESETTAQRSRGISH